jgi:molybdopterin converting factor small subunit
MILLHLKFIGSLKHDPNTGDREIELPDGAVINDLIERLGEIGLELGTAKYVVVLNGLGLHQWPPDLALKNGDTLMMIPPMMGG